MPAWPERAVLLAAFAFLGKCLVISSSIHWVEENFEASVASHREGFAHNPIFANSLLLRKPSSISLLHGFKTVRFGLMALSLSSFFSFTLSLAFPAGVRALTASSHREGHETPLTDAEPLSDLFVGRNLSY